MIWKNLIGWPVAKITVWYDNFLQMISKSLNIQTNKSVLTLYNMSVSIYALSLVLVLMLVKLLVARSTAQLGGRWPRWPRPPGGWHINNAALHPPTPSLPSPFQSSTNLLTLNDSLTYWFPQLDRYFYSDVVSCANRCSPANRNMHGKPRCRVVSLWAVYVYVCVEFRGCVQLSLKSSGRACIACPRPRSRWMPAPAAVWHATKSLVSQLSDNSAK